MKTDRNKLLARLHILLKELGAEEYKREIYADYGVTSSKDMSDGQLHDLVGRLESDRNIQRDEAVRTLRHNALNLLTEMGVYYRAGGDTWSDVWERVNEFLKQDKIAGKPLYSLAVPELKTLIRQLRAMQTKGYRYKGVETEPRPEQKRDRVVLIMGPHNPGVIN